MADTASSSPSSPPSRRPEAEAPLREDRLAEALRDNLRRRKEAARAKKRPDLPARNDTPEEGA